MDIRFRYLPALLITATLGGCDFIGDVFEAGFWVGLIALLIVIAVIWAAMQFFD